MSILEQELLGFIHSIKLKNDRALSDLEEYQQLGERQNKAGAKIKSLKKEGKDLEIKVEKSSLLLYREIKRKKWNGALELLNKNKEILEAVIELAKKSQEK